MPRFSPSVQRVVAVLNLFADHPEQSFTLTDIIRALKLSRATCHSLLITLLEAGYLYRTSDKNYMLGAAFLHVGEVARKHFSPLKVAQPEMRALADEFDSVCSAAFREGADVVIRARATSRSHLGYSAPLDRRYPLLPQFAAPFFVESKRTEIKAWIKQLGSRAAGEDDIECFHRGVEFVRTHGFLFSVVREGAATVRHAAADVLDAPLVPVFELRPKATYDLAFFSAPVTDANRQVAFALALTGLRRKCKGSEVQRIGMRLREACDRISASMGRPISALS